MISKTTLREALRNRCGQWSIRLLQHHSFASKHYCSTSTAGTQETQSDSLWARPKEIPFQIKIANSVKLIGHLHAPIHLTRLTSSSSLGPNLHWAATTELLLANNHSPTSFSIPILFEGDLALVSAFHLKKDDHVYVAGRLSALPSELSHATDAQAQQQVQVLVSSVNFVKGSSSIKNSCLLQHHGEEIVKDDTYAYQLWKDLLVNPGKWWDVSFEMDKPDGLAFQRKKDGESLQIDDSTPKWMQQTLQTFTFDTKTTTEASLKKADFTLNPWEDLFTNPKQWLDYRKHKSSGWVKQNHPDFKHKDGICSLWLDRVPQAVLCGFGKGGFEVKADIPKLAKQHRGDEFWEAFVENPDKWWDNRLDKKNPKAPDFKHKESGEGVWLSDAPTWVLSELPSPKIKQNTYGGKTATLLS